MKKLISMLLVLTMVFTLAISASAANFPDLEGHWAKDNMIDLVERGLLKGDSNGNMNPEKETTTLESLVMLSRFYDLDEGTLEAVHDKHSAYVKSKIDPQLSWAYEALEICLAAKIVSENELVGLKLTSSINKETLSVFLVRALQLVGDTKGELKDLTFDDLNTISKGYVPYVAVLVENGIINGDEKNKFGPKLAVKRGVVSAMLSRSLQLLENRDVTLELDGYLPTTTRAGYLEKVTGTVIQIRNNSGVMFQYACNKNVEVTENDKVTVLSSRQYGCPVTLTLQDGLVVKAAVEKETGVTWLQGRLISYNGDTLYFDDMDTGDSVRLSVDKDVVASYNGTSVKLEKLKRNALITVKVEGDVITEVYATTADYEIYGTVHGISLGSTVELLVKDDAGTIFVLPMSISEMPDIYRGTTEVDVEQLVLGDEVKVTVTGGTVAVIQATARKGDLEGVITGVSTTTATTTWKITDQYGDIHTLTLADGAVAYQGDKAIEISRIAMGDTVEVTLYNKEITVIYLLESAASTANKLTATVLDVKKTQDKVTVQLANSTLVYVDTSKAEAMIQASTGKTISLSDLEEDDTVLVYGKYTSNNQFRAATVILED